MRQVVAYLIGLVLICNLSVLTVRFIDQNTDVFVTAPPVSTTPPAVVPGENQVFVSGTITRLVASAARTSDTVLPTPATLMTLERGSSRARVEGALVGGDRVTISWDGGVPLPISGAGGIDLGLARLRVDSEGLTWLIDGAPRGIVPGSYQLGAPVAVGGSGLARPRAGVEFEADEETVLVAENGVVVHALPRAIEVLGPGEIELEGDLELQFAESQRSVTTMRSNEGPYQLSLEPGDGLYRIEGIVQAEVTTR